LGEADKINRRKNRLRKIKGRGEVRKATKNVRLDHHQERTKEGGLPNLGKGLIVRIFQPIASRD